MIRWSDLSLAEVESALVCQLGLRLLGERPHLAAELHRSILNGKPAPIRSTDLLLPLNFGDRGALVLVVNGKTVGIAAVLNGIHIVRGADNEVFGRWDRLIAVQRRLRRVVEIPGHGGEIIPGRLSDHVDALRHRAVAGVIKPVQLDIDPTMACPSSCPFCFSNKYRTTRRSELRLTDSLLFCVLDSWIARGVKVVRFDGGGDPMAHPRCIDAIERVTAGGARTALLTAGDLLRLEQMERLVQAATYVRISINAASDKIRAAVHGRVARTSTAGDVYDRMAKLATKRNEQFGSAALRRMPLGATYMIHKLNASDIVAAARRVRDAGFDHISYRVVLGTHHAVEFTQAERKEIHHQLSAANDTQDDRFRVFVPNRELTDTGYVPGKYFKTCVSCTHRVLVEVGRTGDEAAIVPCGRYRGSGFAAKERQSVNVLAILDRHTDLDRAWSMQVLSERTANYPQACHDCIDRSANLMLNGMLDALNNDSKTWFFRATGVH